MSEMNSANRPREELMAEIEALRTRLEESEETLRAIGSAEVDAFVVSGPGGEQIFTLKGAEQPYRALVETMNEGAATLSGDGTILYCNHRLAAMLQTPMERLLGMKIVSYVAREDLPLIAARLEKCSQECSTDEVSLITEGGNAVPVLFSTRELDLSGSRGISLVVTDLTQQHRNEEIMASERLANSIIEQAGEAIVVCDEEGMIIRASRLAHQLCGENPLLKPFDELFRLRQVKTDAFFSVIPLLHGNYFEGMEVEFKRRDNRISSLKLNASPLKGPQGSIVGCVVTLSDFTGRKQAEKELQAKNTELERFAYTISHDLKSPLITIQAYAGMIFKDIATGKFERAQDDLKRIEGAANKMTALLNDLLNLSRAGRIMSEPLPVDMNRLVKETLRQLAGPIKGNHVEIVLQPGLPPVHGDEKRIAEVVQNLIENAIKYRGDQALPRIEIGTRQDGINTVFFVSDNGKGIDPSHHEKVF
ncbi:MAG: PAS domain-containing sensor histidine kinase, partial [Desulfuromonadaceae bacterium]